MFKSYLLTAWQNLVRQKLFACINILGLAIGLAVFLLIFLYVEKEFSWDRQWADADRLYWLVLNRNVNGVNSNKGPFVPTQVNDIIRENFPEAIEISSRVVLQFGDIKAADLQTRGNIMLVDQELLQLFDLEIISGSLSETLAVPGRVALTEQIAQQYFGEENPLGRKISLTTQGQGSRDYLVTAVYKSPRESSLILGSFSLLDDATLAGGDNPNFWTTFTGLDYYLLAPGADVGAMNRRMVDLVDSVMPVEPYRVMRPGQKLSDIYAFEFSRLSDAHFSDYLGSGSVDKNKVLIFALIGVLVLLMGSTNFVILATAKADDRRKEVAIRKVLGAKKNQLVLQFLNESVLQTAVSLVIAIGLVAITLPVFSALIGRELIMDFLSWQGILFLLLFAVLVGVLSGLYPAFVLAGFNPVSIFRPGRRTFLPAVVNLRNALVCIQFIIATALIVATLVVYFQLNHIRTQNPGFIGDHLFAININFQEQQLVEPLVNEINALPGVEQVARSSRRPGPRGTGIQVSGNYIRNDIQVPWSGVFVDYEFFDVYGIPLLSGRVYDPRLDRINTLDTPAAERQKPRIVMNRQYAQSLGFASAGDAVGQYVVNEGRSPDGEILRTEVEIIGVVENSRFESLREPPKDTVYILSSQNMPAVTVRYSDAVAASISADLEQAWKRVAPDSAFQGVFISTALADEFQQEDNEGRLLLSFAAVSLLIATLGLYGLATYTVKKSIKEVGIRKVLGADIKKIMLLFLWRFSIPVLAANVIAWPVAIYAMLGWLQRFPEQIGYGLLVPICLLATIMALVIAWVTVSVTTAKAARADPVKSLRYE